MERIVLPSTNAHWYYPNGNPCHQVECSSKGKKGEMRDVTVRDARKMGLYPSVTNIIRILDKPSLNSWREEQAILAALTLPGVEGETVDERARRVAHDAKSQVDDAARRGKQIHKCVETYLLFQKFDPHPEVAPLVERFPAWADKHIRHVYAAEQTVVGDGYAGTLDLHAEVEGYGNRIMDFKSRKPYNGAVRTYDEDNIQLSAYWGAVNATGTMSVFINSQQPDEPVMHAWENEETQKGWVIFDHLKAIWCLLKNYTPDK